MGGLLEQIAGTVERHWMFTVGQRVGVAVSGGADSVCLLHVLLDLAARWDLRLSVIHLDHGLRGGESRDDAKFVREMAGRLGLPFHLREVDVGALPGNLEQAARRARLGFFLELIHNGVVDRVALGHTRGDQAETVLFRFLRGSGTAGLAGIRPVTAQGIVRPMIETDREAVECFLRDRGIEWREDSSNASPRFARNRIRHELLPQLERTWNPAIRTTLVHTADWAQAEEAYWAAEVSRLARELFTGGGGTILVDAGRLAALPLAVGRRLARDAIGRVKGDLRKIEFVHVEAVLELAGRSEGHGRVVLPGVEVCRSLDWVRFAPSGLGAGRGYCLAVEAPGEVQIPGTGLVISLELIENPETSVLSDCVYNGEMAGLDWRSLSGLLEIRNWRPGDQYQPLGSTSTEKIKTLFQFARIPSWERRQWPILTDGASIVWARRFGPAASVAARAGTKVILKIRESAIG